MRAAIMIAALLATRVAAADPAPSPPGLAPLAQPAQPAQYSDDEKSGFVATSLALAGTALPIGIIYASSKEHHSADSERGVLLGISMFAFTPSLGHWYAGRFWTIGMGTRMVGLTLASVGALRLMSESSTSDADGVLLAGGLLLTAGGALLDIITASEEADSWNREHANHIKPVAMQLGHGGYGVGLGGSF